MTASPTPVSGSLPASAAVTPAAAGGVPAQTGWPPSATPWCHAVLGLLLVALGGWAVYGLRFAGPRIGPSQAPWVVLALVLWLGLGLTLAHLAGWARRAAPPARPAVAQAGLRARVLRKWLGLHLVLVGCGALYAVLPEYQAALYQPFLGLARRLAPWLSLLALPYLAWVDRRMPQPRDLLWSLGDRLLGGTGAIPSDDLPQAGEQAPSPAAWRNFALGWLVKAFFLPMMFGYAVRQVQGVDTALQHAGSLRFMALFELGMATLYFIDVVWGTMGYLWSLRLTDSHVRTAEPTAAGWALALLCYEPFSRAIWPAYFAYDSAHRPWNLWLADWPWLQVAWGLAILALTAVYAASTAAFGLRFSNLTHRGIITSGPYRWCKHPAYLAKNLSWWLISMPFMVSGQVSDSLRCCAMLLGVNLVYWLRARSEERHLGAEPAYLAYADAVARQHGRWRQRLLPAILANRVGTRETVGAGRVQVGSD